MKQSSNLLVVVSVVVVAFLAMWLGKPHRELDWQNDVLPLAHAKMNLSTPTDTPLEGMIVVLTGATSGIGLALTKALAKLGATIVAIGRSPSKLKQLEHDVKGVEPVVADLNDLESVSKVADTIKERFHHVDVLINNAGMHYKWASMDHPTTKQGYDQVFGVNYLSHFLLQEKLLPLLENSTMSPTIIGMSSSYHWAVDGSDLYATSETQDPVAAQPGGTPLWFWRDQRSYANSKLAQVLNMRSLARLYPNINIVSVCPGWVATQIAGTSGTPFHFLLAKLAFDADSWGMASTFYALLHTTTSTTNDDDYIVNSKFAELFHHLTPILSKPWMYRYGLRDAVSLPIAMSMMPGQVFTQEAYPTKSSPESYNTTLQDSLYKWSMAAVKPFL